MTLFTDEPDLCEHGRLMCDICDLPNILAAKKEAEDMENGININKDKECGGCGSDEIYRKITLTDKDGIVLDSMNLCKECWYDEANKLCKHLGLYEG